MKEKKGRKRRKNKNNAEKDGGMKEEWKGRMKGRVEDKIRKCCRTKEKKEGSNERRRK